MKKLFLIISASVLTTNCSFLPNSCPTETDHVKGLLETKDSIVFPDKYEVLEEVSVPDGKQRLYNSCFQLSHIDLINFINTNNLHKDTLTYGVFSPSGLGLLKKEKRELKSMPELRKNGVEFYADTLQDKLYISKYY